MGKNIFQKIGDRMERSKKSRQKEKERYWKLPAQERMHYDMKLNRINKEMMTPFSFFIVYIKFLLYATVFLAGIYIVWGEALLESVRIILGYLFGLTPIALIVSVLIGLIDIDRVTKQTRKLKKRFKIIK